MSSSRPSSSAGDIRKAARNHAKCKEQWHILRAYHNGRTNFGIIPRNLVALKMTTVAGKKFSACLKLKQPEHSRNRTNSWLEDGRSWPRSRPS